MDGFGIVEWTFVILLNFGALWFLYRHYSGSGKAKRPDVPLAKLHKKPPETSQD